MPTALPAGRAARRGQTLAVAVAAVVMEMAHAALLLSPQLQLQLQLQLPASVQKHRPVRHIPRARPQGRAVRTRDNATAERSRHPHTC